MNQSVINLVNSLYVIRGVIRGLRRTEGRVNDFSVEEQQNAMGATLGAALAGNTAGAVGGMQSLAGTNRDVTFFNCKIGRIPVSGHFEKSNFKEGDEVEAVISSITEGGVHPCIAIARPADRVIWTPGNGQGVEVKRRKRRLFVAGLCSAVYLLFVVASLFYRDVSLTLFVSTVGVPIFLGFAALFYFTEPQISKEIGALEQKSLELLGFECAGMVDISKRYAFHEPGQEDKAEKYRMPLCFDAFRYDNVRIIEHEVVNAERPGL